MCPELDLDEVEEGDDVAWAELRAWGFAEEEEVEEFDADGVTLEIEAAGKWLVAVCLYHNPSRERERERALWRKKRTLEKARAYIPFL